MLDRVTRPPPTATTTNVLVAAALLASFGLKLHRLGHLALRGFDESFHAVVAQNLIRHPLLPTLYDRPFLPVSPTDWQNAHVWLHKGIVPLWQMALSMSVLGHSTFAVRFPSAVLGTLAAGLTYLIGLRLMGRWGAATAAVLQAFNPATWMLTQGMSFSDHIDIALLFWTELSIWLLLITAAAPPRRRILLALAAGIAQGLAFNSKSYPALIAFGVALAAWIGPRTGLVRDDGPRVRGCDVLWMIAGALFAAAPWLIYCRVRFPQEFAVEQLLILKHLTQNVEGWAGPWDRVVFDYLLRAFHVLYPTLLAALPLLAWRAWRSRDGRLVILLAWFLGAVTPMILATAKTPSATLLAWPAGLLLLGALIERAAADDVAAAVIWVCCGLMAAIFTWPIPTVGLGYSVMPVIEENNWVVLHIAVALAAASAVSFVAAYFRRRGRVWPSGGTIRFVLVPVGALTALVIFVRLTGVCWRVTQLGSDEPAFEEIGQFVRTHLPPNTALLVAEHQKLEHMTAMFYCGRSAYAFQPNEYDRRVGEISANGGLPVVLSRDLLPLRPLLVSLHDGWTLYECNGDEFRPHPSQP